MLSKKQIFIAGIALTSCILVIGHVPATASQDGFISGEQVKQQVYANSDYGFSFRDPTGWSGLTQGFDKNGVPLYALPPDVRHITKKGYGAEPPPTGLPSWIELHVATQQEPVMKALQKTLADVPSENIVATPTETSIGGKIWAVAEYRFTMPVRNYPIPMTRKLYLTEHQGAVIAILGTSPIAEYDKDRALFDVAVSTMTFDEKGNFVGTALKKMIEERQAKEPS